MSKDLRSVLVLKAVKWSLMLPLIGAFLMCLIPGFGLLVILFIFSAPFEAVKFIYFTGYIPSLVTAGIFFSLATRASAWLLGLLTIFVSAGACAIWQYSMLCLNGSSEFAASGLVQLFSGIAALAGAILLFSLKSDDQLRELRSTIRRRAHG